MVCVVCVWCVRGVCLVVWCVLIGKIINIIIWVDRDVKVLKNSSKPKNFEKLQK